MPNRYICDVIREVRTAIEVGRIDMVLGLVEEIQVLANRMEAKLADYDDMGYDLERGRDFKKKLRRMRDEAKVLNDFLQQR